MTDLFLFQFLVIFRISEIELLWLWILVVLKCSFKWFKVTDFGPSESQAVLQICMGLNVYLKHKENSAWPGELLVL